MNTGALFRKMQRWDPGDLVDSDLTDLTVGAERARLHFSISLEGAENAGSDADGRHKRIVRSAMRRHPINNQVTAP